MTQQKQRIAILGVFALLACFVFAGQALAYEEPGKIGDTVWWDMNHNGVQDNGEPGLAGWTVTLTYSYRGTPVPPVVQVTDANGHYLFDDLYTDGAWGTAPWTRTYTVTVTPPAGWVQTYDLNDPNGYTAGFTTPNAASVTLVAVLDPSGFRVIAPRLDVDFGYMRPLGSLGDTVWNDVNGDGFQQDGEAGLAGWTVTLVGDVNVDGVNETLTTTTDSAGVYHFYNLPAGTYQVTVTKPWGWVQTYDLDGLGTPDTASRTITWGQNVDDVDFGYYRPLGSLGDRVWYDANGDGVQDDGEVGINGLSVVLYGDTNLDNIVDLTLTTVTVAGTLPNGQQDGLYLFSDLPAGRYVVQVVPPSGYNQTYGLDYPTFANQGTYLLGPGVNTRVVDFGYTLPVGSLGDRVWYDGSHDGVQDSNEAGINGVLVTLTGTDIRGNSITRTDTTDGDGDYLFTGLLAGDYTVTVSIASAYIQTYDYDGTDSANKASYSLKGGEEFLDLDFGYYLPTGSLGDRVWNDYNNNGLQDIGEPGINGVTVTLTGDVNGDGALETLTDTTEGDGIYGFTGLHAGLYTVTVTPPEGMTQTYDYTIPTNDNRATYNLSTGEAFMDLDFGYYKPTDDKPFVTYTQGGWGSKPSGNNPGMLLKTKWSQVFPNGLEVGIPGAAGFSIKLTSASAVQAFLPQGGTPSKLKQDYTNPTKKTEAGVFAGQVTALKISVSFSDASITREGLAGLTAVSGPLAGKTVGEILDLCERALGGENVGYSITTLNEVATAINENFDGGTTNNGYLQ